MPIAPPLASPGSALAVASRPRQSADACWGIAPEQTGLELAQLPCRRARASARRAPALGSQPRDRASPTAPAG
jgi:hypothetical protein